MRAKRLAMSVAAAGVLSLCAAGLAESVWVQRESVDLLAGKGAVYPAVATAKKGTELTVVSRDGKWVQVQMGTTTGWVYEGALSVQKVSGGGGLFAAGTPGAAEMSTGAAAKGLQPDAEKYVSAKNLDKRPLEALIAQQKALPPAEWERFVAEGKLNR